MNCDSKKGNNSCKASNFTIKVGNLHMVYSPQYAFHFVGYLGCFTDDGNRQLDGKRDKFNDNSLAKCSEFCQGYKYLGLQVNTCTYI